MKHITKLTALSLLILLLLSPLTTLAQESTEAPEPTPTQEVVAPTAVQQPTTVPTPTIPTTPETPSELDGILTIIGSIGLVVVLGGSFFIGYQGLKIAGISVPQETVDKISDQIIIVMKETMTQIGQQVQATPSPVDDAIWSVGRIPVEKLIEELTKRPMTPDETQRAYAAITKSLDLDTSVLGQGVGSNDPK